MPLVPALLSYRFGEQPVRTATFAGAAGWVRDVALIAVLTATTAVT